MKPIKLLILTSSYPRHHTDSASVFLRHLVEHLQKRNIMIHVLTPSDNTSNTSYEDGVTVHRFSYFFRPWQNLAYGSGILPNLRRNPWLWIEVPFFFLSMTYWMIRLTHKERPDLIHAHWVIPQGLVAIIAKFFLKVPVVTTIHGGDAFALKGAILNKLKLFILSQSEAWTANTYATSAAVGNQKKLINKRYIIPMGINVGQFQAGRGETLRLGKSAIHIILFVGRLVEKKGVCDLINAFAELPFSLRLKTELWIVGDGEQKSTLQMLASNLGVEDRVKFWGKLANNQLPDYYAAADLFVAPSIIASSGDTEGQGVVFLEAFAARTCAIGTKVGGISEVIEDGSTGILVPPGNPKVLATAIEKLLNDAHLRRDLSEKAFKKVQEIYSWNKIALDFESVYRTVLS